MQEESLMVLLATRYIAMVISIFVLRKNADDSCNEYSAKLILYVIVNEKKKLLFNIYNGELIFRVLKLDSLPWD